MSSDSPPQSNIAAAGEQPAQWPRAARYMAAAFLVIAIGVLLVFLVPVISTVALGFIFAFLMYLPIRALLEHTHMRYPLAVVLLYLLLVPVAGILDMALDETGFNAGYDTAGFINLTDELHSFFLKSICELFDIIRTGERVNCISNP